MTLPESQALIRTLERVWGEAPIRTRTMGGTVPIDFFIQALEMPAICLPVVNFDNNQHSHNENLRLQNLWDAVDVVRGDSSDVARTVSRNRLSKFLHFVQFVGVTLQPWISLRNPADFPRQLTVTSRIIQPSTNIFASGQQGSVVRQHEGVFRCDEYF